MASHRPQLPALQLPLLALVLDLRPLPVGAPPALQHPALHLLLLLPLPHLLTPSRSYVQSPPRPRPHRHHLRRRSGGASALLRLGTVGLAEKLFPPIHRNYSHLLAPLVCSKENKESP